MTILRTVTGLVLLAVAVAGGAALAQPPLTRTPTAAPGYTNVVVTSPVNAAQEGTWTVKAVQDGTWSMKVADVPLRTIAEPPALPFIRVQKRYSFSWGGAPGTFLVTEIRTDGWIRATNESNRRPAWINTRQLAVVEELP